MVIGIDPHKRQHTAAALDRLTQRQCDSIAIEANLAGLEEPAENALLRRLLGADDREVLVDEDVVRPVDADVVDLVFAVAQLHNTVDDAPRVGDQRSFRCLIGGRSTHDRA